MERDLNEKILTKLPESYDNEKFDVAYSDNDLMIIDNIKDLDQEVSVRVGITFIMFCKKGRIQIDINGKTTMMGKNQVLVCPPFTVVENPMASPDYECKIICMTNNILQSFIRPYINIWNQALYVNKLKVVDFNEMEMLFSMDFYGMMKRCIDERKDRKYKKEIIGSLVQAGLLMLCSMLEDRMRVEEVPERSYTENTFRKFLELLDTHGSSRHTVMFYAGKLFITPKYLSLICAKHSGKTAKEWIQDYVLENVRYCLRSTDMSIKEISDKLGFPNASYLGRYVKEHFGVSPMTYRNSKEEPKELKAWGEGKE